MLRPVVEMDALLADEAIRTLGFVCETASRALLRCARLDDGVIIFT